MCSAMRDGGISGYVCEYRGVTASSRQPLSLLDIVRHLYPAHEAIRSWLVACKHKFLDAVCGSVYDICTNKLSF